MAVKPIKDIYKGYFQKSKVFLHPALGLKRAKSIHPIETYLTWENEVSLTDMKLVIVHYLRTDTEFQRFEEACLFGNSLYDDYREIDDDSSIDTKKAAYIFNLSDFEDDFKLVLEGKYSKLSERLKTLIQYHYGKATPNYAFIHSYLYPEEYYKDYGKFLSVDPRDVPEMTKLVREVGELCNKPDLNRENLKLPVFSLDLKK